MSLIKEIHAQSHATRLVLWSLSVFSVLAIVGFFFFNSIERQMYVAMHPNIDDQKNFIAQQDARMPNPLAAVGKGFGALSASIGNLLGIDNGKGFDRSATQDKVYLLPLSK